MDFLTALGRDGATTFAKVLLLFVIVPFVYLHDAAEIASRLHDAALKCADDIRFFRVMRANRRQLADLAHIFRLEPWILFALVVFALLLVIAGESLIGSTPGSDASLQVRTDTTSISITGSIKRTDNSSMANLIHLYSVFLGLLFLGWIKWAKVQIIWLITGDRLYRWADRADRRRNDG